MTPRVWRVLGLTLLAYVGWSFVETIGLRQFSYDQAVWDGKRFVPTGKFVTVCDDAEWKCWVEERCVWLSKLLSKPSEVGQHVR